MPTAEVDVQSYEARFALLAEQLCQQITHLLRMPESFTGPLDRTTLTITYLRLCTTIDSISDNHSLVEFYKKLAVLKITAAEISQLILTEKINPSQSYTPTETENAIGDFSQKLHGLVSVFAACERTHAFTQEQF